MLRVNGSKERRWATRGKSTAREALTPHTPTRHQFRVRDVGQVDSIGVAARIYDWRIDGSWSLGCHLVARSLYEEDMDPNMYDLSTTGAAGRCPRVQGPESEN